MKTLKQYLTERLIIKKSSYKYFPETKEELREIIKQRIDKEGPEVNLNDIDVSNITDMSYLFKKTGFNGNISNWDVSNVTNMRDMFYDCKLFNQNISNWNVSKVKNSFHTFFKCSIEEKYKPHLK